MATTLKSPIKAAGRGLEKTSGSAKEPAARPRTNGFSDGYETTPVAYYVFLGLLAVALLYFLWLLLSF
jgi:hypothetical protein